MLHGIIFVTSHCISQPDKHQLVHGVFCRVLLIFLHRGMRSGEPLQLCSASDEQLWQKLFRLERRKVNPHKRGGGEP